LTICISLYSLVSPDSEAENTAAARNTTAAFIFVLVSIIINVWIFRVVLRFIGLLKSLGELEVRMLISADHEGIGHNRPYPHPPLA
jgi:hypothetical protein